MGILSTCSVHSEKKTCKIFPLIYLNSILPVSCVHLIPIKPLHGSLPMSNVVEPHPLIDIPRGILTSPPAMFDIVDPISIIIRSTFAIVVHLALLNKRKTELSELISHSSIQVTFLCTGYI